jgi:hypothetical protein
MQSCKQKDLRVKKQNWWNGDKRVNKHYLENRKEKRKLFLILYIFQLLMIWVLMRRILEARRKGQKWDFGEFVNGGFNNVV